MLFLGMQALFHTGNGELSNDTGKAFVTALVMNQGGRLRRFLLRRVKLSADVPDLVQEIYLRMLRIPDYEAIRSPEAYLFTVAQHVVQQHGMRQADIESRTELQEMFAALPGAVPEDPAAEVLAQEALEKLEQALHQLHPRERATFLYHRRDGRTLQEIATRFGVSRQMVKKYLARAVLELRRQLREAE
jgi:RNA polymerase sigma-70 factor (ECF subfamily)